jgi:beta-lactam-binding protein with PASTA domain
MQSDQAKAKLNQLGFTSVDNTSVHKRTSDPSKDGLVFAEDPTPGYRYTSDTKITLTVYKYVKPAPTCDPNKTVPPSSPPPSGSGLPSGSAPASSTPISTPSPTDTNTLPPCTTP